MGLHVQPRVVGQQLARHRQLLGAAGGGKTRCHRIGQPAPAVPALDQGGAIDAGLHHVVAQVVGRVAVHQHLAGDHAHAPLLGGGEQRVGAGRVHGGEHHRRRAAVRQQRVQKHVGCDLGKHRIGMARLSREGVGVEPVEQLGAPGRDHIDLRAVHMGVDEAWQQQAATVVELQPVVAGRLGLHCGDAAVGVDQQPVCRAPAHRRAVAVAQAGVAGEVEQISQDGTFDPLGSAHARPPTNSRATSRTCSRSQRTAVEAWVSSCQSW